MRTLAIISKWLHISKLYTASRGLICERFAGNFALIGSIMHATQDVFHVRLRGDS